MRIVSPNDYLPPARWRQHGHQLGTLFFNAHADVMDDGLAVVAFDDVGTHAGTVVRSAPALDRWLCECGLAAGASDVRLDIEDIPRGYREACAAAAVMAGRVGGQEDRDRADGPFAIDPDGAFNPRHKRMCTYDECRCSIVLGRLRGYAEQHDIVPCRVRELERHDADHGTQYVVTLMAFLRCLANKAAACRELNVHRTTLDYRLERIAAIAGIDVDDPFERRELLLLSLATGGPLAAHAASLPA